MWLRFVRHNSSIFPAGFFVPAVMNKAWEGFVLLELELSFSLKAG